MFSFKKTLILLLCTVILIGAALPAFALTGYEVVDKNLTSIGVRARCTSNLTLLKAEGKLSLSYLPAYSSNYLPEGDYFCTVKLDLKYGTALFVYPSDASAAGMQVTKRIDHSDYSSDPCTAATFTYVVNGSQIHVESMS